MNTAEVYRIHICDQLQNHEARAHLIAWIARCKDAKDLNELKPFNYRSVWAVIDTNLDYIVKTLMDRNPDLDVIADIAGLEEFGEFKARKLEEESGELADRNRQDLQDQQQD